MAESAAIRIVADLKPYLDEVKKLGPMTDQEALKAAMALESRVTKAAQAASKASEKAAADATKAAAKAAQAAERAASDASKAVSEKFQIAAKVASLTGDVFGNLAGPIGDVGDAFELMGAKGAIMATGVGLIVQGFGAFISTSLDVIRNAEDYKGAMGESEEAILGANEALDALDLAFKRQKSTMAGELAPVIEDLSYAYIGISDNIGRALDYLANTDFVTWLTENSAIIQWISGQAERGRKVAEEQKREEAAALAKGKAAEEAAKAAEEAARAAEEQRKRAEEAAAKRREELAKRADQARKAAQEQEEKDHEANMTRVGELQARMERLRAQSAIAEAFTIGIPEALTEVEAGIDAIGSLYEKNRQYQFEEEVRMAKEALAVKAALEAEAAAQKADQDRKAQQEFEKQQIEGIAGISGYIGQTLGLISGMYDANTKEGRKAIREMAIAQKAAAIFDVAIKGVQAVMAALTIPPPAGPILAVAAGVTAAASAASVAAQPLPSFHSGRFAGAIQPVQPDESPAMLRRGEVVVPAPTVRANGGVDGVRQRLGERGGDGGMVLAIDLTDRRIRLPLARDMARAIPASPYLGWAF